MYRFAAAGLIVIAVAIVAPTSFSHSEALPPPAPIPTMAITDAPSGPARRVQQPMPTPYLAASDLAAADRHMGTSSALRAFLGGTAYTIKSQAYWTKERSTVPFGVVREIVLARPVTTAMRPWPVSVWSTEKNDYQQFAYNARYLNVTTADIHIDKEKGVVSINPRGNFALVQGPGNTWMKTLPKGDGPK